jgi:uncharacterized membrane-anchored protein YitT (DUF2179 family)
MTENKWKNALLEFAGCFLSALGVYNFAVAARVPVTGVSGICAILFRLFGLPIGFMSILINIPIAIFCYKTLGRDFFLRSVRCMIYYALLTDYLLPHLPVYPGDRMLAAICGGVVSGIGDGLIYMQNSSTGGMDFITMAIKSKHPYLPFGNLTFAAALAVILANGVVFRDVDSIIYGLILNFLAAAVINKMMFGFNSSMLALIITDKGCEACNAINDTVDRGSTIIKGYGGWKQDQKDVVLCACTNKQLYEVEHAVKRLDPCSFIIMLQSYEVQGEGFRRLELGRPQGSGKGIQK